jgi:methylated-DNA-[protein]-cysteine S-methyltransferase
LRFHVYETDLGWAGFAVSERGLRELTLPFKTKVEALRRVAEFGAEEPVTKAEARRLERMMDALVSGRAPSSAPALDWTGITPFRRAVMEECARIPIGRTLSYAELAAKVGRPGAARAVGRVMATNPFPLLVPCHRVVGSDGTLHGYGGGLPMKAALLKAEGAEV